MIVATDWKQALSRVAAFGALAALVCRMATGQQSPPMNWTAEQDHQNMMDQLGIKALRPGPSGNEKDSNHANYDEAKADPYGDLPDALTLKSGQKVTSAEQWWNQRRPEIVEDFEREVVGRIPPNVPKVTWAVKSTTDSKAGVFPVVEKQLVGHVDNSAYPSINVDIEMTLVTPGNAKGPVPVMIMFSSAAIRQFIRSHPKFKKMMGSDLPPTEQLVAGGRGYALLDTSSIQADNGAGLTKGIIGLTNKGQPRKPEDWGALRAWAWGASRGLDYMQTDKSVDAKRVGIEGVSRYGKAALVTMAFDTRFAVALVGSSGEGGVKPYRRNFGEAVENLTGSGEYHWMAGNFLKYGAAQASFGSKNASNLPVDSNELIALCAPRPTFISYGVPAMGDARWLDHQGSFMATVAAGAVFRLLGAKDLGVNEDYHCAKMPPVNTGLLNGQLAWRQHDGGHTDAPNWKHFIPWADKLLDYHPTPWELPAALRPRERRQAVTEWWKTFFDQDYLRIWGQMFTEEANAKQAAELWSMLDLNAGCRVLDAPCGWGRLSRPLALLGATVLGVDQSETLLTVAEDQRKELPPERLRYLRHDLREPLPETGFDVACNIFTSFGYGTEEEDAAIFRTLRRAVRPGGRVVVETNHRDLMCAFIARGSRLSMRMPDGTLFVDEPDFDAISGVVSLNWYWSGPGGSGEKHAKWRCYTPTQIVGLLERTDLRFAGAYRGLSKTTYKAEGPEAGGRLAVVAVREG